MGLLIAKGITCRGEPLPNLLDNTGGDTLPTRNGKMQELPVPSIHGEKMLSEQRQIF